MTATSDGWYGLPAEVRREVEGLARKGRRHPDSHVVAVAHAWASARMASRGGDRLGVVIDVVTGSSAGAGQTIAERRLAKKLLAISSSALDS